MNPNGHRQWARPSLQLKELNAAECEGLAYKTSCCFPTTIALRTRSRFKKNITLMYACHIVPCVCIVCHTLA